MVVGDLVNVFVAVVDGGIDGVVVVVVASVILAAA